MLGDSININNFSCNPVVLKKKKNGKTSKNGHFRAQRVQKRSQYGPYPKQKTIFFAAITKGDHKFSKTFYFIKISNVLVELGMFFYFV